MEYEDFRENREIANKEYNEVLENRELENMEIKLIFEFQGIFLDTDYMKLI